MGVQLREDRSGVVVRSIDVASVAANTTAEQTFPLPGVRPGDYVSAIKPSLTAGLGVVNARVSAVDTVALTFSNSTAAPIDPAAENYLFFIYRPEVTFSTFSMI